MYSLMRGWLWPKMRSSTVTCGRVLSRNLELQNQQNFKTMLDDKVVITKSSDKTK